MQMLTWIFEYNVYFYSTWEFNNSDCEIALFTISEVECKKFDESNVCIHKHSMIPQLDKDIFIVNVNHLQ